MQKVCNARPSTGRAEMPFNTTSYGESSFKGGGLKKPVCNQFPFFDTIAAVEQGHCPS
jgi:hypothetical protein